MRSKKVWIVLDRDDVVTLIYALENVMEGYSSQEHAAGYVENENRMWELLTEKLQAHHAAFARLRRRRRDA